MRTSNQKASLIVSLFLGIFLLFSPLLFGAVYYVDFTTGDDGDTGLTEELAWKTWNFVRAKSFNAGDTIKFKRGETWTLGEWDEWDFVDSGTSGAYITVEDYGSGNKPIIVCEEEFNGRTWADEGDDIWSTATIRTVRRVRLDGVDSYMPATSAEIDGSVYLWHWNTDDDKLFVYATQNPNTEYTNIKVNHTGISYAFYLTDCSYVKFNNLEIHGGLMQFSFKNGVGNDESYITIENCDMWYFQNGIVADKDSGGSANNVTVQNCDIDSKLNLISGAAEEIERCVYDLIRLENECSDWLITTNTLTDAGHSMVAIKSSGGTQGCHDNIVENNTFDGSGAAYTRAWDIGGDDGELTGNIFRYNIEVDCSVRDQIGGNDNEYYCNLIYDRVAVDITNKTDVSEGVYLDEIDGGVCDGNLVYNNVFYGIYNEGISLSVASNCVVKNNIVMDSGKGGDKLNTCVYIGVGIGSGNVISNNNFYDADTADVIDWQGTDRTVAYADANYTEFSTDISSDPKFVNPSTDFHLQSDSPCIEKGVDVGLTRDYEGNDVPYDSFPEIGAYEFLGPILPPPSGLIPTIIPVIIPIIR